MHGQLVTLKFHYAIFHVWVPFQSGGIQTIESECFLEVGFCIFVMESIVMNRVVLILLLISCVKFLADDGHHFLL